MSDSRRNRRLQIVRSKQSLARAAADLFVAQAKAAVSSYGRFLVALSGGSTPQTLFALLAEPIYQAQVDWPAVHVFWGDERLVPAGDPGSNAAQARRLLLDHVPIPPSQIHTVRGDLPPNQAVVDYEKQLRSASGPGRAWPHFDLAIMGLGTDGHTASLFPGMNAVAEQTKPVVAVLAEYQDRPARRLTLTPPVFNDAYHVMFLVSGSEKAKAVAAVLNGPQDPSAFPAQAIQPSAGELTWIVDEAAAQMLHAG